MPENESPQAPAPALRDVAFNFAVGEVRKATVAPAGITPFEITFRVPSKAESLELSLVANEVSEDALASRGVSMVRFIARHLDGWSLPHPADLRSLNAINDPEVLFALFNAIYRAGRDAKNS